MGEIKSTLDLVMERTRNLTLSMEEKEGQQNADIKKRLTALAQKYEDQIIKLTEFIDMLNELKKHLGPGLKTGWLMKYWIKSGWKEITIDIWNCSPTILG
jgi:hypothetical protein